jgi:hypothetical protein
MLLLEELRFMMICSKLPTKSLVLEQVLERLMLLLLLFFCNVKLTFIVPLVVMVSFPPPPPLNLSKHLGLVIICISPVMVDL